MSILRVVRMIAYAACGLVVISAMGCSDVSNGLAALTLQSKTASLVRDVPARPIGRHKADSRGAERMLEVGWALTRPPHKRTVEIASTVSWCTSFPRPSIRRVARLEGPRAVVLTAIVGFPKPSAPGEQGDCLGVQLRVQAVVHLDHVLGDRPIYDGSHSPAVRRWPRPNRG